MNHPSRGLAKRFAAPAFAGLLASLSCTAARADNCNGAEHCFDAGPFAAEATSISPSWDRTHRTHYIRLNLRFRNAGTQPISLAFPWRAAATMTDNYGNTYGIDWRWPQRISGIAVIGHDGVKGNFTIAPGSSRTASWIFSRDPGQTAVGTVFSADLPVEDLEPIPGQQKVKVGSQYSLNFTQLSGGVAGAVGTADPGDLNDRVNAFKDGVSSLLNVFTKKK